MEFLFVAMGGAIGAMARYAISLIPIKSEFPLLTVLFWKTGVCGGFTTFSTFSLEAFHLMEHKQYSLSGIYIALSVLCCLLGILCGNRLAAMIKGSLCP